MPSDSTAFWDVLLNPEQLTLVNIFAIIGVIATIIGTIVGIIALFYTYLPYRQQRQRQKLIEKEFGSELYLPEDIERSTKYYIRPNCTNIDPGREAELRQDLPVEEDLFQKIDKLLDKDATYRHLLLLADSGMGKSSFVLNYYAHNQQRPEKERHRIAVVPLGIKKADKYIQKIEDKRKTVIYLDAFDEDTRAIKNHRARLTEVMEICQEFRRVLITCRTQFFPRDEEIPKETGIARVTPYGRGKKGVYEFWKLYLAPLNDDQIEAYIIKRFPVWRWKERRKARELEETIPLLSVRPMLLAYIPDIMDSGQEVKSSYDLYKAMVDMWLVREEGKLDVDRQQLEQFSEKLAVAIFVNREKRGTERIPRDEIVPLAEEWGIKMEDWKLTGRSLLNRDADGNCKFAHRSIMEYLFIKQFIAGNKDCRGVKWTDQMKRFFYEMLYNGYKKTGKFPCPLEGADFRDLADLMNVQPIYSFRSKGAKLAEDAVKEMLIKFDFFDLKKNETGKGDLHIYESKTINTHKIVIDHATGLTWQQGGSEKYMLYKETEGYIKELNAKKFAGFNDWRLPTLEEAMSLMETKKSKDGLYIDSIFDATQRWIWTTDQPSASAAWCVNFTYGGCDVGHVASLNSVRAVCSPKGQAGQSLGH